jgi:hypothetical protein
VDFLVSFIFSIFLLYLIFHLFIYLLLNVVGAFWASAVGTSLPYSAKRGSSLAFVLSMPGTIITSHSLLGVPPSRPILQDSLLSPPTVPNFVSSQRTMDKINDAVEFLMICFYSYPDNSALQATPNNNIVITDEHNLEPLYIQTHLAQRFPLTGF